MADGWTQEDGVAALQRIGLELPRSARVKRAEAEYGQDDALRLIVEMPAADWAAFEPTLHASDGNAPTFRRENNYELESGASSPWVPKDAAGLKTAQLPWRGGKQILNLGVMPVSANKVRLFVFWYQL